MITERSTKRRARNAALAMAACVISASLMVACSPGTGGTSPAASRSTGSTASQAPSAPKQPSEPAKPGAPSASGSKAPAPVPSASPGKPSASGSGKVVPVEPVKTKNPVPLDKPGDFGTGLSIRVDKIDAATGKATVPGEIAGPALKLTLKARNSSKKAISLDRVTVFLSYGKDKTPASQYSEGAKPFKGSLGPGKESDGVYIYNVPKDERDLVRVEVSYTGEAPTVTFEGPAD